MRQSTIGKLALVFSFLIATLSSSAQNQALDLSGAGNEVNVTYNLATGPGFTVEQWIYLPSITQVTSLVNQTSTSIAAPMDAYVNGDGSVTAWFGNGGSSVQALTASGIITPGVWHHVAVVYDPSATGQECQIFVDGNTIPAATQAEPAGFVNTGPIRIGRRGDGTEGDDMYIDEVRIWSIPRDGATIGGDYNQQLIGNEASLDVYLRFENDLDDDAFVNLFQNGSLVAGSINYVAGAPIQENNYALSFDGTDDYLTTDNGVAKQLNQGTIEAWVNASSATAVDWSGIAVKQLAYGMFVRSDLNANFGVYDWNASFYNSSGVSITDDTWHHVAFSFNSGVVNGSQLYLDGVAVGPAFTYTVNAQTSDFVMAAGAPAGSQHLNGSLDEVRIWNTVRSASQIAAFKDVELNGPEPGLVAYYDFSNGPNNGNVSDLKGGNPGLLTNMNIQNDWIAATHGIAAAGPLDTTNPDVTISSTESDPTAANPIPITITFTEEVAGFDLADIQVINGTPSNLNTADNIVFTADVAPSAGGLVSVDVFSFTLTDLTGNGNNSSPTFNITYDVDPPLIAATILSSGRNLIYVEFEEDVFGAADGSTPVDVNDFDITVTGGTATITKNSLNVLSSRNVEFDITINGSPDGSEVVEVVPFATSVYDAVGNVMSTTQSANQLSLVDNSVLSFDGADDFVRVPTNAAFENQNYTVEAWVNIPVLPVGSDSYAFVSKGTLISDGGLNRNGFTLLYGDLGGGLAIALGQYSSSDTEVVQHPVSLTPDTWYHIAATYDGTTMRLYLDGVEVATNGALGANDVIYTGDNLDLKIGAMEGTGSSTNNHRGLLDEVRIWNYVRSGAQISALMDEEISGTQNGLVAYYDFNDAAGSTLTDLVAGRNGTLDAAMNLAGATGNWASGGSILDPVDAVAPTIGFAQDLQTIGTTFIGGTHDDNFAVIEVSLDGGTTRTQATNNGDGTWGYNMAVDPNFGGDVPYTVDIYAIDEAENEGSVSGNVTIDLQNTLSFDGVDDYVEAPDAASIDITGALTLETWVFLNTAIDEEHPLITKWNPDAAPEQRSYLLQFSNTSDVVFAVSTDGTTAAEGTNFSAVQSPYTFQTGRWYHIAATYEPSTFIRIYVNGELIGENTTNVMPSIFNSNASLVLGDNGNQTEVGVGGVTTGEAMEMDEVRIWSEAKSHADIQAAITTELSGSELNLEAYYDFNLALGTALSDRTSNANNATLNDNNNGVADGTTAGPIWGASTVFATDVLAPFFVSGYPLIDNIGETGFDITVQLNEQGQYFYVIVPDGATAPNVDDVRAGTGFGGTGQLDAGNIIVSTALTDFTLNATGLSAATDYDLYIVAQDDEGGPNVQALNSQFDVTTLAGPAPGAVSANLSLWLKADQGVTGTTQVSQWDDQAGGLRHGTQGTATNQPALTDVAINYNPAISFDGTDDFFTSALDISPTGSPDLTTIIVFNSDQDANNPYRKLFGHDNGNFHRTIGLDDRSGNNFNYFAGSNGVGGYFNLTATTNYISTTEYTSTDFTGFINGNQLITNGAPITGGLTNLTIGAISPSASEPWDGNIAEMIMYSGTLTAPERQRIETYLAIKYGISIDQTAATNYVASDGNPVWDGTANATFNQSIAGIGRDDQTTLDQKQSMSADGVLSIALGTFAASNQANANAFANDLAYLVWGDNGSDVAFGARDIANVPSGIDSRIQRVWRASEANSDVGNVTLRFDLNGEGHPVTYNPGNFKLLLDTDADFSTGAIELTADSYAGGIVEFNAVNIANGQFFTLGINEPPLPPTNFVVYNSSPTEITFEWTDNATNETGYQILEADDYAFSSGINTVANIGADVTSLTHTPVSSKYYMVFPTNGFEDATSQSSVEFATTEVFPGQALDFDGTGQYVSVADNDALSFGNGTTDSPMSVEAWIYLDQITSRSIVSKRSGENEWHLVISSDGRVSVTLADQSSSGFLFGESPVIGFNTGEWYHIAFTYDGSSTAAGINTYVNGVLQTQTPGSSGSYTAMENTNSPVEIGSLNSGASFNFDGQIDELKIWDFVKIDYSDRNTSLDLSNAGYPAGLVAYYPLDEGAGSNTVDRSRNTNDGTFVGGPTYVSSTASLTPPAAPTNLIAYATSTTAITLEWLDNATDETGYNVERDTDPLFSAPTVVGNGLPADIQSFVDNAGVDQRFYYRVQPTNGTENASSYSATEFGSTFPFPGQALSFDGSLDYISFNTPESYSSITIEAWINTAGGANQTIYTSYDGFDGFQFAINSSNQLTFSIGDGVGAETVNSSESIATSQWTHIAVAFNGSSATFYENGLALTTSGSLSIIPNDSGLPEYIGRTNSGTNLFSGELDELKIWDNAKSDFSDRFAMQQGNEVNLVLYYPFDENGGSTVTDRTVNTNDGSISGTPSFNPSTLADGVVTNTNDTGVGSLRDAIDFANVNPGTTINFSIGETAPWVINLGSALPQITAAGTIIDGFTQPGWVFGDPNAMVQINGSGLGNTNGININAADVEVYGLILTAFNGNATNGNVYLASDAADYAIIGASGKGNIFHNNAGGNAIYIVDGDSAIIRGNRIGTLDGIAASANGDHGISTTGEIDYLIIGGDFFTGEGNVISGAPANRYGLNLFGSGGGTGLSDVTIAGNKIGTNEAADGAIPNALGGINILGTVSAVTIGGASPSDLNIISGNGDHGIIIQAGNTFDIEGNYIGLQSDGSSALGNAGSGIRINPAAINVNIGTSVQNIISENVVYGILFDGNNSSNTALGNNIFSCNQNAAIGYGSAPLTNTPVIQSMTTSEANVDVTAADGSTVRVWLADDGCNNDQALTLLGTGTVASNSATVSGAFPSGQHYTAIVEDLNGTSEFSAPIFFVEPYPVAEGAGEALIFDGLDDDVNLGDISQLNGVSQFTVEGWFLQDVLDVRGGMFAKIFDGSNMIRARTFEDGMLYTYVENGVDGHAAFDYSTVVSAGEWFHFAMVFDGTQPTDDQKLRVFVNGVQQTLTFSGPGVIPATTSSSLSGVDFILSENVNIATASEYWDGQIDEFRIWDFAMPESSLREYLAQKVTDSHPSYANLMAYYRMDDSGDVLNLLDFKGAHNGTINGGAAYVASGAHLGDFSFYEYTYPIGSGRGLDDFRVDNLGIANLPLHVYRIDQTPANTIVSGFDNIDRPNYYGVFAPGQTYDVRDSIGNLTSDRRILYRADGADPTWTSISGPIGTNIDDNELYAFGQNGSGQFTTAIDQNPYPTPPDAGYAMSFDGVANQVSIPDSDELSFGIATSDQPFTAEAWVNLNALNANQAIISKRQNGVNREYRLSITSLNEIEVLFYDEGNGGQLEAQTSALTLNTNEWNHIAFTYDGSSLATGITIYLNGVTIPSTPSDITYTAMSNTVADLELGIDAGLIPLNGQLDEVRIWNIALPETNIRDNMIGKLDGNSDSLNHLVAYYRFDENSGATAANLAGDGDGTVTGATPIISGAPQGSGSIYAYDGTPGVLNTAQFGEDINVHYQDATGGIHGYLVAGDPNQLQANGFNNLDQGKYFGVFAPGGQKVELRMDYNNGGSYDPDRRIVYRTDATDNAAVGGWERLSGLLNSDVTNDSIFAYQVPQGEVSTATLNPPSSYPILGDTDPGSAMDFDGTDDYMSVPHSESLNLEFDDPFSIEAWVNTPASGTYTLFSKIASGPTRGYRITINSQIPSFQLFNDGGASNEIVVSTVETIPLAQWSHLVVTYDGSNSAAGVSFYLDGVLLTNSVANDNLSGTIQNTENLFIGIRNDLTSPFQGQVDELRIWNAELAAGDISAYGNTTDISSHPNYTDMLAYYKFDEGTGSILQDVFANNDGTWNGPSGANIAPNWVPSGALANAPQQNALNFAGDDDFVNISRTTLAAGLTYEAWINTSSTANTAVYPGNPALTVIGDHNNNTRGGFGIHDGRVRYAHWQGSALDFDQIDGTAIVNDGLWHHIAVSHDHVGDVVRIYVDGVLDVIATSSSYRTDMAFDRLGGGYLNGTGTGALFNGSIDEVRIWNGVISEGEIRNHMYTDDLSVHPDLGNLVLHYTMNQGDAANDNTGDAAVFAQSGGSLDGALVGFTLNGPTSNFISSNAFDHAGAVASTLQATNITPSTILDNSVDITWTNGDGRRRIVAMFEGIETEMPIPSDNQYFHADSNFGGGDIVDGAWYAVYNGYGNSATVLGLNPGTDYTIAVLEVNGPPTFEAYNSGADTNNPVNFTTTGGASNAFITTWSTSDGQITIPRNNGLTYNYDVSWTNVTNPGTAEGSLSAQTGNAVLTGLENGSTYEIAISGTFPAIQFGDTGDKDKILTIEQWGDNAWESMVDAFNGCSNLTYNASDSPDLSGVTTVLRMFRNTTLFNADLSSWNFSTITNFAGMFENAAAFDQDLGSWDVSNATNMSGMLDNTGLTVASYDNTLNGWSGQSLQSSVLLTAVGLTYSSSGQSGRDVLTNAPNNWFISGDALMISNYALDFDGLDDHVQVSSPIGFPIGSAPRTLEFWFKSNVDVTSDTDHGIVQYGTGANDQMFGLITTSNAPGKLYFFGFNNDVAGVTDLVQDQWYHAAVTYDGSDINLYLDGNLEASNTAALNTVMDVNGLTIGRRPDNGNQWDGQIDEVRLWDHARSQTEIQNNMNNTLFGSEGGLVAYYPMSDGTGSTTVADLVGGPDGTLTNMDENTDWVEGPSLSTPIPGSTFFEDFTDEPLPGTASSGPFLFEPGTWDGVGVLESGDIDARGGTGNAARVEPAGGNYIQTPPLDQATTFGFWYKGESTGGTYDVLASNDGGVTYGVNMGSINPNPTYQEFTLDFTSNFDPSYTGAVRIVFNAGANPIFIDDVNADVDILRSDVSLATLPTGDANVNPGDMDVLIYKASATVSVTDAYSEGFFLTPNGADSLDFANTAFDFYQNIGTDDFGSATLLGTSSWSPGDPIPRNSIGLLFNQTYTVGQTVYFYVTADIRATANAVTFNIDQPIEDNFGFGDANKIDGGLAPGANITINGGSVPLAATDISFTEDPDGSINLSWTDNATDETDYIIEQSTDNASWTPFGGSLGVDAVSFNSGPLSPETAFWWRVVAVGSGGNAESVARYAGNITAPGNALDFDGVDDHVNVGDVHDFSSPFTLEAWVSRATTGSSDWIISNGTTPTNTNEYLHFGFRAGDQLSLDFFGDGVSSVETITDADWHHVAAVYDPTNVGNEVALYLDGEALTISDASISPFTGVGDLRIGQAFDTEFFQGQLDEVRVWSRSLSQGEIQTNLYNTLIGNEANLMAYYRFDHSSEFELADYSDSNISGFLQSMDAADWVASGAMMQVIPDATFTTINVTGGNVTTGTTNNLIYKFSIAASGGNLTKQGFGFDLSGDAVGADFSGNSWRLFESVNVDVGDPTTASEIGATNLGDAGPGQVGWTLSGDILDGDTHYYYVLVDIDGAATNGNSFNVTLSTPDPLESFGLADPKNKVNGGFVDGQSFTIQASDVTSPTPVISSTETIATNINPIPISVDFGEVVTGFDITDLNVVNGTAQNFVDVDGQNFTFDILPTIDGTVTVNIADNIAQDLAGNQNAVALPFSIIYDGTGPAITLNQDAQTVNDTNLSGTISDPSDAIQLSVDGGTTLTGATNNGDGTWTYDLSTDPNFIGDGAYTIYLDVADSLGNQTISSTGTVTIDQTAPVITIDGFGTSITSPQLTGTIDDVTATIDIAVDGANYAATNNGDGTWALVAGTITSLADGTYDVVATATDASGNTATDASSDELIISQTVLTLAPIDVTSTGFTARWSEGLDVQTYQIDVSDQADFSTFISGFQGFQTVATSVVVSNLDFSSQYYYRVRLVNTSLEVSANSNTTQVQTIIDPETEADSLALVQISNAIAPQGLNWASARLRDWDGITLDLSRTRVEVVNISGTSAAGNMPNPFTGNALTNGGLSNMLEMNASNNQISGLMDYSGTAITSLNVSGNNLEFDDLEPVAGIATVDYSNQASIQYNESTGGQIEVRYTNDYSISITTGGTSNVYTWYRNDVAISSNADYLITDATGVILAIDYDNMGTFRTEVTNALVPGLTIDVDPQDVLAIADMQVSVADGSGNPLTAPLNGYMLETTRTATGFSVLETLENVNASTFTFPDVVLGDYIIFVESDLELYIPTYFGDVFEWTEADTLFFRSDDVIALTMTEVPPELTAADGEGTLGVLIEEDFEDGSGRIDARRRAAKRKCGLRRKRSGGRTGQNDDEFELIAYGETDDNGEFQFGFLPQGTYRFFVEYPGIPIDDSSFVQFEVGEAGVSDTDFKLQAFATADGIEISIEKVLGVILEYFKDLEIYPNPSSSYLNIRYRHLKSGDVTAELVDLSGNSKWSTDLRDGFDGQLRIDVEGFEEGIYILRFYDRESPQDNVVSFRVIVKD
ncbi:MAG: LamG-like jellyroll fold domain-containing protein [Ekhidna sp.]